MDGDVIITAIVSAIIILAALWYALRATGRMVSWLDREVMPISDASDMTQVRTVADINELRPEERARVQEWFDRRIARLKEGADDQ